VAKALTLPTILPFGSSGIILWKFSLSEMNSSINFPVLSVDLSSTINTSNLPSGYSSLPRELRQRLILLSSFLAATITVAAGSSSSLNLGNFFFAPIIKITD